MNRRVASRSRDGYRHLDVVIYPIHALASPGAVIRVDDVSEHVRMEEMMMQAEKMMSLGGLAAGMAHEINNPLGGISMSIQNIELRLRNTHKRNLEVAGRCGINLDRLQEYLVERGILNSFVLIKEAVHQASDIINTMLNFSRQNDSKLAPTDLSEIVDKALILADHDFDSIKKYDFRDIEIIREFEPNMPLIPCTKSEVSQVLLNLLKNAAYAMKNSSQPEKPQLKIRVGMEGKMAQIEVADNGPGINKDNLSRLFEPFFTTKPVGQGTGLGLSVAYMIITQNHGGKFDVESVEGDGTRFIIQLPQFQST